MTHGLALVMIVRDEARCIERCLASARGWVSEMVVLDTGSQDDTAAIAARCGARVHSFTWIDDFSAARNAALALTDAPWRLVLDADEWIVGGAECLATLDASTLNHIGQICVTNQYDMAGGSTPAESPAWLPRVLPRGACYSGRIHEQPDVALPRRRLPLVVAHDGYRDAQRQGKLGRNERLLSMALAEAPGDAYLHYQLARDLELRDRFDAALPHYLKAHTDGERHAAWRHDLVLRLVYTLKRLGRHAQAMQLADAEMPHWQHSPDFFFTLGDLLLDWAATEPQRGAEMLPMIDAGWQRAIEIGENPQLHDSVRGRGSFLAAHNLAVLHESLGQVDRARYWREREREMRADSGG